MIRCTEMNTRFSNILIISDIEGSSGCWSYKASSFLTDQWCRACVEMSLDVNAVVRALFAAGVQCITVKDYHRSGYNLLPELIDSRAAIVSGYRRGPVPGIGDPHNAQAVLFLGMHAASGSDGFLAHTLTSRIKRLEVNGRLVAEVELFAASLATFGVRPVFFSGCPVACKQAKEVIPNIISYSIDKRLDNREWDVNLWRAGLSREAVKSLENDLTTPYEPVGPFTALVTMRDGEKATQKLIRRWNYDRDGARIRIRAANIHELYLHLIKLCYLTPTIEHFLPFALFLYNIRGRLGLMRARRRLKRLR
jgi:D-amino peptidase